MIVATRHTASVELDHARRGTANPTVHTEHALQPRSLFVGAGLEAERCRTGSWFGFLGARRRRSVGGGLHFAHLIPVVAARARRLVTGRDEPAFSLPTPTND